MGDVYFTLGKDSTTIDDNDDAFTTLRLDSSGGTGFYVSSLMMIANAGQPVASGCFGDENETTPHVLLIFSDCRRRYDYDDELQEVFLFIFHDSYTMQVLVVFFERMYARVPCFSWIDKHDVGDDMIILWTMKTEEERRMRDF